MAGPSAAFAQPAPDRTMAAATDTSRPRITEPLLRYYLEKALTLQGLADLPAAERRRTIAWVATTGVRFAGRTAGYWYSPYAPAQEQADFDSTRRMVEELKAAVPGIIVQGAIFEIVTPGVNNLPVPNAVRAAFGEDTLGPGRNFRFDDMMYPAYYKESNPSMRWDNQPPGIAPGVPDMSRSETQLWFYYRAVRLLDAGCEAIHFGQVNLMNRRDPGHHAWWRMLRQIRAYARTRNRGFVLCDAHVHGEYYDPIPRRPLPDSLRQLLFDFHSFPARPRETALLPDSSQGAVLVPGWRDRESPPFGQSKGGRTPTGWLTVRLPMLAELDNFGVAPRPNQPGQPPWVWGRDEISWFAYQPAGFRNQWLVYASAQARLLDPAVYLQLPGRRSVTGVPGQQLYSAAEAGQVETIRRIWAGQTAEDAAALLNIGPELPGP
ncbi:hypothetical protein LJY25_05445 [Hymenobacter sp. BT175]|uniref:hypothetical protein n=1 Tax=Hymenobacter translucens TaxID=2886507 RepID=UPI001D0F1D63|nr:hypothetical protein [Hymenobacter translucens]MCC2545880.1 hypothetical protein [Hymenobacter translucens]